MIYGSSIFFDKYKISTKRVNATRDSYRGAKFLNTSNSTRRERTL